MKILFLGDYSNLHACLGTELKKRGHEVTILSDGGRYMDTARDILLFRKTGLMGTARYMYDVLNIIPKLKDYDVVQLINPNFLSLRPGRIKYFFDMLKGQNRSMFLTLAGNDYFFVKACMEGRMFRFSEFKVGDRYTEFENSVHRGALWIAPELRNINSHVYENIDGAMSILPEYDMAGRPILGDRLSFTNIPVDFSYLPYKPMDFSGKIKIFIGMRGGMETQKGTAALLEMCRRIERMEQEKCEVTVARNLPLKEYLARMAESHIVLDQLYSYSPGTNGLQAMALGKVTGTGAQPEYYNYIGNPDSEPILCLSPLETMENLEKRLKELLLNPEKMSEMGRQGRALVERNNRLETVADKFEKHWNNILSR